MPFNLNDFKSVINYGGALKSSRYEVTIANPPLYIRDRWGSFGRTLKFRCEATRLPGLQFASADGPPRLGYGPIERHPYNVNYEEISLTFIMDAKTEVHKFFYDWCNCIFNFKGKGGTAAKENSGRANGAAVYEVGYKDQYSTDINIDVYKDTGVLAMTATLYKAFPMALPAIPMGWNDSDIVKLTIPFSYLDFDVAYAQHPEQDIGAPAGEAPAATE